MYPTPQNRPWTQLALAAVGLMMGAGAAYLTVHQRPPAAPVAVAPKPAPAPNATALYVQHDGRSLRLHWNPDVQASSGILWITDGERDTRLDLNAQELHAGVATYWPDSREVNFRLELDGNPAGAIRASADKPPEPESQPAPVAVAAAPTPRRAAARPVRLARREPLEVVPGPPPMSPPPSRWSKMAGKIPLLRRLRKH